MRKIHKVEEKIYIQDSISARAESCYLVASNKNKCKQILAKNSLTEEEIIDFLISLHIILEVSLNSLFRNLSLLGIKKEIGELEVIKNIDNIGFIDKTILFIYNSKFNFNGNISEATHSHRIIGVMKDFAAPRNKLLHGHSISTIFAEGNQRHTPLRQNINQTFLEEQVKKFKVIIEGMRFYLDCLDSSLTESGKESFKKEYLDDSFLNALQ